MTTGPDRELGVGRTRRRNHAPMVATVLSLALGWPTVSTAQDFDFLEKLDEKRVELLLESARELAKDPEALGRNPEALELVAKPLLENAKGTLDFVRKGLRSRNEKERIGSAFLGLVLKAVVEHGDVNPDDALPAVDDEARAAFRKHWPQKEFAKVMATPPKDPELTAAHEKLLSFHENLDLLVATITAKST